jgi:signal transduction histidine kinase
MVLLTSAILCAAVVIGTVLVESARTALEERILRDLSAVATAKETQVTSIIDESLDQLKLIASRAQLRECLARVQEGDPDFYQLSVTMNRILLEVIAAVPDLLEITIANATGTAVASTSGGVMGGNPDVPMPRDAAWAGDIFLIEDKLVHTASAPVYHPENRTYIGSIIIERMLTKLPEILTDYTGLGDTGEVVIGKREDGEIKFMGPLRHEVHADGSSLPQDPSGTAEPMARALDLEEGIVIARDYRDEEVLAAYTYVTGGDLGLVAKVDTEEAFLPIPQLRRRAASLALTVVLIGAACAYLVSRTMSTRVKVLHEGVRVMSSGQLNHRVEVRGRDEIGDLGEAFNHMAARLEEYMEDREKAQRMAGIGETTAMVGHDLRTPLQVMVTNLYLARRKLKEIASPANREATGELEEIVRTMEGQTDYMTRIVSDLQDFAKSIEPKLVVSDPGILIDDAVSSVAVPDSITVTVQVEEGMPMLSVDPGMMKRVLTNLVTNAIQAMPDGGQLEVSLTHAEEHASISVTDTGVGIPEENLAKLFQPLFTTKPKGQGLGLAVCKRMVGAHGGKITVRSQLGEGTTFTILLPSPT